MTMFDQATPTVLIASVIAGTALIYLGYKMVPRKKKCYHAGKVEELWVFPIKSFKGIQLTEVECTQTGLSFQGFRDRYIHLYNIMQIIMFEIKCLM